ncbi:MAG: hypothetical protein WBC04_00860 [Candidatus Acidiferrales bacterium]
MTYDEKELVAALEADIHQWEFVARHFEHAGVVVFDGKKMSGWDYSQSLRKRITEYRALIEKVKKG